MGIHKYIIIFIFYNKLVLGWLPFLNSCMPLCKSVFAVGFQHLYFLVKIVTVFIINLLSAQSCTEIHHFYHVLSSEWKDLSAITTSRGFPVCSSHGHDAAVLTILGKHHYHEYLCSNIFYYLLTLSMGPAILTFHDCFYKYDVEIMSPSSLEKELS